MGQELHKYAICCCTDGMCDVDGDAGRFFAASCVEVNCAYTTGLVMGGDDGMGM